MSNAIVINTLEELKAFLNEKGVMEIAVRNQNKRFKAFQKVMISNPPETQEKELLCEIYRNALVSGNNQFLNPERPLYRAVLTVLDAAAREKALVTSCTPSQVCQKLFFFVQSYIYQWLASNELTFDFLTETCIAELRLYLTLYLPGSPHAQI